VALFFSLVTGLFRCNLSGDQCLHHRRRHCGFSLIELYTWERWEEWINLVLGVWLIISPWVLGFNTVGQATRNMVLMGILMIILPLWVVGRQRARI